MKKYLIGNLLVLSSIPMALSAAYAADPAPVADSTAPADSTLFNPSSTSNTTTSNATAREQEQLAEVTVQASHYSLGGGLMSVQDAPKAVSTISREAILQAAPGATYAQMIQSIPGVLSTTDDVTGLNDGDYKIRGFTNDEIGVTVNGAPINDSGNYKIYPTEYGDTENMGDITVLQGYPDVDQPVAGAAGGTIAWATIDPAHKAGVDLSLSSGSYGYQREFVRFQTGDLGPVRAWVSYSYNHVDLWRGPGDAKDQKVDGKLVWTVNDRSTVSASFQYNNEFKYGYNTLSKAQIASGGYFQNYDLSPTTASGAPDTYYWKVHTNPFENYLVSLDGEFRLTDTTRLSVVPYYQYGTGGGGTGYSFNESTAAGNYGYFGYTNQDVNGDGQVSSTAKGTAALVYELQNTITRRPGIIAKVFQEIGHDDSLEAGFWFDEPRQEQSATFSPTVDGTPLDNWQDNTAGLIRYTTSTGGQGGPQYLWNEYTKTSLSRGFLSDTWTPINPLSLTAGIAYTSVTRNGWDYEYYGAHEGPSYKQQFGGAADLSYHGWTPSAGIKFQLNDQNQLYAGYGRTYRAPINGAVLQNAAVLYYYQANPGEIGYSGITPQQIAAIQNNKPEVSDTIDVGWRYYTERVSASVDAYASNLKNKQLSGFDEATSQVVYLSVPEVHQRGLNAEASWKIIDDLTLYGSYAYTVSRFAADLDSIGDGYYPVKGNTLPVTPKNTAYLRLNYDHGPFWLSLTGNYRSSFWSDWMNTDKAGGFTTLDLGAGWRFDDIASWLTRPEIKINVFNVTDKRALTYDSVTTLLAANPKVNGKAEYVDPHTGSALYASGAYYGLLEPRTVMVTLKVSLF